MTAGPPRCGDCGAVLRNGFDALIHAFEHGAEHRPDVSAEGRRLADDVAGQLDAASEAYEARKAREN